MAGPLDNPEPKEEKAEEAKEQTKLIDALSPEDHEIRSLARSLGIDNEGNLTKHQDRLSRIYKWAKEKGAEDAADVIWSVQQLANRIGSPPVGTNNVEHLSTYAYLELERMELDKKLKRYHDQ